MAEKDIADELEEFEADLNKDDDGESLIEEPEVDIKDTDETGQKADPEPEPEPVDPKDEPETPPQDDPEPEPNLTTLPDDKDAFGDLAGKTVTAKQLIDEGLLNKLVTWGHQGRHLIQKGQDDIEAAKAETSEAQKLRELLEAQFAKEDKVAEAAIPRQSEEEYVGQLSETYLAGLKSVASQGGIEEDFVKEFPKSAVQIEHRFQTGADMLSVLSKEVTELREYVGMRKKADAETARTDEVSAAGAHFDGLITELSGKGDLYSKLSDPDTKEGFVQWVSSDESGLGITGKEVAKITEADVHGAWLLYASQHPEKFAEPSKKNEEEARLASGGGGNSTSTKRTKKVDDELGNFQEEYNQSLAEVEY